MKTYTDLHNYISSVRYYTKQCAKQLKHICDIDNSYKYSYGALNGHINYIVNSGSFISKLILKYSNSVLDTGDFILVTDAIKVFKDKNKYTLSIKLDSFGNYFIKESFDSIDKVEEFMQYNYLKNFNYIFTKENNEYTLFSITKI